LIGEFEVVAPDVEEALIPGADAESLAQRRAEAKAEEVARRRPGALVIGADTVVECRGEVIGKPVDRADAVRMLTKLTSHPHRVITGLCVVAPDGSRRSATSVARIRMRRLSQAEIEEYVDAERPMDRAGAYGLKELDSNVLSLEGSASAVIGLPLEELESVLRSICPENAEEE
jgi:septum formation protein